MKMPYGKYKGMEISQLPASYLHWLAANFEPGEIRTEAEKVLSSETLSHEQQAESLEEQANKLLGEKPVKNLRRGFKRGPRRR